MTPSPQKAESEKPSITNEELLLLPLRAYTGNVILVQTAEELEATVKAIEHVEILGFDTETRPSFRRGEFYKVSLVQLATPDAVYLIQIQKTGLSESFAKIFSNPNIIKAGVAIRDDIKGLQKFRRFQPEAFVDLSLVAREKGIGVESVKKLTGLLLGFRISKSAQTSNWEMPTLTEKQIEYAATDAWVCLEIYHKLIKLEAGS